MNVCVIPARGGSKRIPRKNIKNFNNIPVISLAISTAKESGCFDYIFVSTEDKEIAQVAKESGAHVPFLRPIELADDWTDTRRVIEDAIPPLERTIGPIKRVCCIYPATPLLKANRIREGFELLLNHKKSYVFPIQENDSNLQRSFFQDAGSFSLFPLNPHSVLARTQDIEKTYRDAGQFYWAYKNIWLINQAIHDNGIGLLIPRWETVDIDTLDDWNFAEKLFQLNKIRRS